MQVVNPLPLSNAPSAVAAAAVCSPASRRLPSQEPLCSSSSGSRFGFLRRTRRSEQNLSSSSSMNQKMQQQQLGFGRRRQSGSRRNSHGFTAGVVTFSRSPKCRRPAAVVRAGMAVTVREDVKAPSWERLEDTLTSGAEENVERLADARERVFGSGEEPQVVFYRDTWSTCPYCERVWLYLEEKQVSYSVEKIDMSWYGNKPDWYKDLVPNGAVPAVKLDGKVLSESLDIMFQLEEKFPEKRPLLPNRESPEFAAVDEFLKLEKELVGAWVPRLRQPVGDSGVFESAVDRVNSALSKFDGPYFLGKEFSLVDAAFAPFLERIAASMPYWHGVQIRGENRWPSLNAWFEAMDSRPSYQSIKADDFSVVRNLESQLDSVPSDAGFFYRALVDGTHGSWELPLKPETTAWGTDDLTGRLEARREAARYLIDNHETILENILTTLDITGDTQSKAVDEGFRFAAQALLVGFENVQLPESLQEEVGSALAYLKDRILVPRDMTYPAARQLRAHLQWLVNRTGVRSPVALAEVGAEPDSGWNAWLYPSKEELPDDKEMSIFDHLEELRQRLAISGAAITVAILGCFIFSRDLIRVLEAPVYSQGVRFLQLSPGEFFFTTLKVSGYCGLLIGSPVILFEIIAFVIPGLTRSERRFLGPIVLGSSILFYAGVVFSYIVLTPAALNFFVNYAEGAVESLWSIDQYFEFVLVLLFSTGLSFQVPVIQLLLGQTRLVTGDQMLSIWKYVVVGSVAVAAVLTPSTDPLTQLLLAGPLMGLYFGGAYLVKFLVTEPESTA